MNPDRTKQAENGMSPRWKPEEVEQCANLRSKGWTAGEIARRMKRSRNEILGKLWRLKRRPA
jgi:hypothetical protein